MAVPEGYRPIGPKWKTRAEAAREVKFAKKHYGDSYIFRPVKSGSYVLYYQVYWKRGR